MIPQLASNQTLLIVLLSTPKTTLTVPALPIPNHHLLNNNTMLTPLHNSNTHLPVNPDMTPHRHQLQALPHLHLAA